jgi:RNA polymerase sigma-70 factor (ECF subfamily)
MSDAEQPSEETLAQAMFQGDAQAARELIQRYRRPLFGLLVQLTGSQSDAEDLFQDTFVRALGAQRGYDRRRRFKPWLFAIAVNLARDRHRREHLHQHPSLTPEGVLPEPAAASGAAVGGHAAADRLMERHLLEQAVAKLPPAQREVVVLRFFHDFREAEIAETLGLPKGTVKSRLHQAIGKLRGLLTSGAKKADQRTTSNHERNHV